MDQRPLATESLNVTRVRSGSSYCEIDLVVVEEPLEIRLGFFGEKKRESQSLSITMRTPGNDVELALGFLWTEGIIHSQKDVLEVELCGKPAPGKNFRNVVRVELRDSVNLDLKKLQRHFYTTSSCGVCGKSSMEALRVAGLKPITNSFSVSARALAKLISAMNEIQSVFQSTGGLHAAALFSSDGKIEVLFEDIGRHNAVDKVLGYCLSREIDVSKYGIMVSGRAGFELVQKAAVAGTPVFVSLGAPSSLSVELAGEVNMTLVGFLKQSGFNIYTQANRISSDDILTEETI